MTLWLQAGLWGLLAGGALVIGALAYLLANVLLARYGARHRKRSGGQQPAESEQAGSGTAIAIGTLLDGVPESVVLSVFLLAGEGVGIAVLPHQPGAESIELTRSVGSRP